MPQPPASFDDAAVLAHIRDLGEACSAAFKAFADGDREELRAAVVPLIEIAVREELPVSDATLAGLEKLRTVQGVSTEDALRSWTSVLEGVYPSRRAMNLVM